MAQDLRHGLARGVTVEQLNRPTAAEAMTAHTRGINADRREDVCGQREEGVERHAFL